MATSFVTGVLMCEAALRAAVQPRKALSWQADEEYWRRLWLDNGFTRTNTRVVVSPTLGWRGRPNYRSPDFNLNSRGLRGVREYSYQKAAGERRIVVVGDSFTFGSFDRAVMSPIADDLVYPARLERRFGSGVSVINLGVDGYGVDQQLLSLREEGFKYAPDLVVAAIFAEDLQRSTLSFRDYAKPRFELRDGRLTLTGVPVPPPEELQARLERPTARSYAWSLTRFAVRPVFMKLMPLGATEADALNESILDALAADVASHGSRLLVMVIPYADYARGIDRGERLMARWARRANAPNHLLRETFLELPPAQQAELYRGHLTPFGHHIVSEALFREIERERLLTPQSVGALR